MKTLFAVIFGLALTASTTLAQDVKTDVHAKLLDGTTVGVNFIDEDGDGVCDNFGTENQGMRKGNRGAVKPNFIDEDGDGVCDNFGTENQGMGRGNRGAVRPNFVDADGDGVCDNLGTADSKLKENLGTGTGQPAGKGFRGGRGR